MAALSLMSVPLREGLGEEMVGLFSRGQGLPSWEQKLGEKSVGCGLWGLKECQSRLSGQLPSGVLNITELLLPAKTPAGC